MAKKKPHRHIVDPRKLLTHLVSDYYEARNPLFPVTGKLYRGESHAIYGIAEDWLACLIARRAPNGTELYVNQILTSIKGIKHGRVKPDIAVCSTGKSRTFRLFLDLKMDLGYKRHDFIKQARARNTQIRKLRQQRVSFWRKSKNGNGHIRKALDAQVAKGLRYIYVVVSDGNIDQKLYAKTRRQVNQLPYVKMITLVRGIHLNEYRSSKDEIGAGVLCMQQDKATARVLAKASGQGFRTLETWLRRSFR